MYNNRIVLGVRVKLDTNISIGLWYLWKVLAPKYILNDIWQIFCLILVELAQLGYFVLKHTTHNWIKEVDCPREESTNSSRHNIKVSMRLCLWCFVAIWCNSWCELAKGGTWSLLWALYNCGKDNNRERSGLFHGVCSSNHELGVMGCSTPVLFCWSMQHTTGLFCQAHNWAVMLGPSHSRWGHHNWAISSWLTTGLF